MEVLKKISRKNIESLPKTAGVYLFYSKNRGIYIGKAVNIKNRVKNHFNQPSYRDNFFIDKIDKIGFIETGSEIEALILEANLIKKHLPKFNVAWRDDKNYFYVVVAQNKQKIPYIFITHQIHKFKIIGPFVEGNALKKTLKYLRRVFPFYTAAHHPKQKCTWCHLDRCPGPYPDLKLYKKNLKKLILILKGKRKKVLNSLKKEMKTLSKENKFEEAGKVRDKIYALSQIISHAKVIESNSTGTVPVELAVQSDEQWKKTEKMLKGILGIKPPVKRIECYDVSNIQGKYATGSMVVFTNGQPDKNEYRKFKIRMKQEPNDIAMLKEVLARRLLHSDWQYPEVILIDGGRAQFNTAIKAIKEMKVKNDIKVISIAKGRQELFIEERENPISLKNLPQEIYNLIKYLDDEAHRFAIAYYKKLHKKALISK